MSLSGIVSCDSDCAGRSHPWTNQGPLNGEVSNGGGSRSGRFLSFFVLFCPFLSFFVLFCPFLSFFVLFCPFSSFLELSRFFRDFPDLSGESSGIFLILPFPLSRPINSSYEEQSQTGPRHNLDLSRKSGKHPSLETPRFSFSQTIPV